MEKLRIGVVTVSKSVHTRIYVQYLVDAGHDVTVITNRDRYEVDGVTTINTRPLRGRRLKLPDSVLLGMRDRKVQRALKRGDFDVVNVQMLLSDGITAALTSPAPVVITLYGSDVYRRDTLPEPYLDRLPDALRRAAVVHACSQHMRDELTVIGAYPEKIETFQYGVDPQLFAPADEPRDAHQIVSVRALRPLYRVQLIVGAMPKVLERFPDARLSVYDTGEMEIRLRGLATDLGVDGAISFLGRQSGEVIARDLSTAGVWVSMAESDGTPISMLEAMAAGAFPVVADLPTLHEWLTPERAVMVDDPNTDRVAEALCEALSRAETGAHVSANREIVTSRADRTTNLARFEALLARAAAGARPAAPDQ